MQGSLQEQLLPIRAQVPCTETPGRDETVIKELPKAPVENVQDAISNRRASNDTDRRASNDPQTADTRPPQAEPDSPFTQAQQEVLFEYYLALAKAKLAESKSSTVLNWAVGATLATLTVCASLFVGSSFRGRN